MDGPYNATVTDHIDHPRNRGLLSDANGIGQDENPVCGDTMKVCIVALHGHIRAAAFEANGCAPTIAAGSVVTEWARDRSVEEAGVLTAAMVEDLMDGLPRVKRHCADLAARALRNAVADYNRRQA